MSQLIQVWQLNSEEQDNLWINDKCPKCNSKIIQKDLTVDYAWWMCRYCDITYIIE